ncbi:hypothetical protein ABZ372_56105, partial [Streptomyces sp. NPDC005921]
MLPEEQEPLPGQHGGRVGRRVRLRQGNGPQLEAFGGHSGEGFLRRDGSGSGQGLLRHDRSRTGNGLLRFGGGPADYWRYFLIANAPESDDSSFT